MLWALAHWRILSVVGALLLSHGAVAWTVKRHYDRAETLRQLRLEITSLRVEKQVLENDAANAAAMVDQLRKFDARVKELEDELEDAGRVCFAEPDARRVRDLWPDR